MLTFTLNAFVAVLVIMDPLGNVPIFASLLNDYSREERHAMIRRACLAGVAILATFTLMGRFIFEIFGITIGAFRIAGGIIMFGIAANMLQAMTMADAKNFNRQVSKITDEYERLEKARELALNILYGPS